MVKENGNIKIFSGNANLPLAERVANHLKLPLGNASIGRFSDGEIMIEINENIRGRDIFIIQSTCSPINDNLMELIIMADAFMRASATTITAVIPYFGYARQDRRVRSSRVPITAKVVADMLTSVGVSHVLTVDLHADQIQGFFNIPVDNIYASMAMFEEHPPSNKKDPIVVSPDVGGVVRARAIAKRLNDTELAIIDKRRPEKNKAQVMHVIGDVKDRDCIIVDDIVDTAGTLCKAASALKENGAATVTAYCTHPVLSGNAIQAIEQSDLDKVIVSDTIPLTPQAQQCQKIQQISISSLIAETLRRVVDKQSVSSMFL
ncbi:MAG TPA: ribose-phosphate pyrophosphokinase [Coxiellaceae bacterium]|nr:ribose-phosphate pyrophosphokinase [Coxiellaceae bacterium]